VRIESSLFHARPVASQSNCSKLSTIILVRKPWRLELQADFYAGVWAYYSRQYLERGDVEEAMRAANAIGDNAI
jgi:predicted metalloprotease